jgi:hypothetical protein
MKAQAAEFERKRALKLAQNDGQQNGPLVVTQFENLILP